MSFCLNESTEPTCLTGVRVPSIARIKGWSSNCEAVGRACGSLCKHSLKKLFALLER